MPECPFDSSHVANPCKTSECPYHFKRSSEYFNYTNPRCNCVLIDVPETYSALYDSSPWTTLSKTGCINPDYNIRSIRRQIDFASASAKVLLTVLTEVPDEEGCPNCGFDSCSGGKECDDRRVWVDRVLHEKLGCVSTPITRTNVWDLLDTDKLDINDAVLLRIGKKLGEAHG